MTIEERVRNCVKRHPDWTSKRISNSTGGNLALIDAVKRGKNPPVVTSRPRDFIPKVPAVITLSDVRQRFDIPAAIKRELARLERGALLPEDELCRLTAGKDRNRFRRALDNNPQLPQSHRIKLRLDDSGEGRFFWGAASDIAEAKRIYEA